ncbi:hypothetical protein ACHAQJ_000843 [Trichoderma viride]
MSGYMDPEMMRAAKELAQSFQRSKEVPKKKVGGGGPAPRQEHWEPFQAGQQSRYGQVTAPPRQFLPSSGSLAPPPSRRSYATSVNFSTGRTGRPSVIGSLGLDFIRPPSSKVDSPDNEKIKTSPVHVTKQESQVDPRMENGSNGGMVKPNRISKPDPISTPPRSSGNGQAGNILDAFYSILAKKPTIGQEIETLANILPKAMDLNAPGTATLDTPRVKENSNSNKGQCTCQRLNEEGKHEKTCPRYMAQEKSTEKVDQVCSNGEAKASDVNNGSTTPVVERKPNRGLGHSHSRKLSPDAPVFVPQLNEAREQTASANGEHRASNKKPTKGLEASMWA